MILSFPSRTASLSSESPLLVTGAVRGHVKVLFHSNLFMTSDKNVASYPGSPAFIQLERNKEGNKNQKMCNTLKAGECVT